MTQDFYKKDWWTRGIDVLIPKESEIETVNSIIFNELCVGTITEESRKKFQDIIEKLKEKGADGVIFRLYGDRPFDQSVRCFYSCI